VNKGFIQIRRGLEEHLVSGQIGVAEAGVYLVMHLQANFKTGIWVGSAPRLLATAPRGENLRDMQRAIERLAEIGFIRVFHEHGRRGNYHVLIHKYEPQCGALKGRRLNAAASSSWQQPTYEPCAEDVADVDAEVDADAVAEAAPILKEEENKNENEEAQALKEPSPTVFSGIHFLVSSRQDQFLAKAFPWVGDRSAEYCKADSWLEENPNRRPRKISRFLHNWFSKIFAPSPRLPEASVGQLQNNQKARLSASDKAYMEQFYQEYPELKPRLEAIPAA
jgi:hypothetical protein